MLVTVRTHSYTMEYPTLMPTSARLSTSLSISYMPSLAFLSLAPNTARICSSFSCTHGAGMRCTHTTNSGQQVRDRPTGLHSAALLCVCRHAHGNQSPLASDAR